MNIDDLANETESVREEVMRIESRERGKLLHRQIFGASKVERKGRLVGGGAFVLDEPDQTPAVWGAGDRVLWAEGEGLMIAGPQGLGKTTIAQQLVLARVGVTPPNLLGLPVAQSAGRVLYLAMDRPRQAARSMGRMVSEKHRPKLDDRVLVWKGPTGVDLLGDSSALADWVESRGEGIDLVVFDSVKDLMPGIAKDEVGAAISSAWQELIARGVQLLVLHHERKSADGSSRVSSLDAIYGSTWLTTGLGSVLALSGTQGDPEVTMHHLKQPAEEVGPMNLVHDHARGVTRVEERMTVDSFLIGRGVNPATIREVAKGALLTEKTASRKVKALKSRGRVVEMSGSRMTADGKVGATFMWNFAYDEASVTADSPT